MLTLNQANKQVKEAGRAKRVARPPYICVKDCDEFEQLDIPPEWYGMKVYIGCCPDDWDEDDPEGTGND
jgi:hypothetical protein